MDSLYPERNEPTEDVQLSNVLPFAKMISDQEVRQGLKTANYIYPTNLQATTIALGRSGKDLLIRSKSGTGKTLMFACIILEKYRNDIRSGPQSIVIVPTRELAIQVADVLNTIGHYKKDFFAVVVIGGLSIIDDRNRLQNAKCVVGTPGRLMHLIKSGILNTNDMTLLIVDEADKLYREMDHNTSLKLITKFLPKERQTIVCSATFENNFDYQLAKTMCKPLLVTNENYSTILIGIKQFCIELAEEKNSYLEIQSKLNAIKHIFQIVIFKQCIIFAGSQLRADSYHTYLMNMGWKCDVISGKHDQSSRIIKFRRFRDKVTSILVTTDLMARGIDSDDVNLVINLDLPYDLTTYLHRIGRAGRFGTHGIAVSCVCSPSDYQFFSKLKKTKSAHESILLKFPLDKDAVKRNIWDFSNIQEDINSYGVLETDKVPISPKTLPVANKINDTNDMNSTIKCTKNDFAINIDYNNDCNDVNTNTFVVYSNANVNNLLLENELVVPAPQPTPTGSQYSPTQYLATSDTIDDASSIAPDSLDSYQQLCRRQSIHREKSGIPKLLNKLNVDDISSNETTNDNANLKIPKSCSKEKSILITEIFDQLRSLVVDKPNNTSNNECLDPFQNYGIYCTDDNELSSSAQNHVMQTKQPQDNELMDVNNTILIYDELDSDESVKTVATKSNKYKLKSSISLDNEIKHFLSPNCEHKMNLNKSKDEAINQDFIQDLSKSPKRNNNELANENYNNVESDDMNDNKDSDADRDENQYQPCNDDINNSNTTEEEYNSNNNYNKCNNSDKIDINCLDSKQFLIQSDNEISETESNESTSVNDESNDESENRNDFNGTSANESDDNYYNYHNNVNSHQYSNSSNIERLITQHANNGDMWNNYKKIYLHQMKFIENYSNFYSRMWKLSYGIDNDNEDCAYNNSQENISND